MSKKVDLGFIYKMLDTRDPSKRRVKPADPDLLPPIEAFETSEKDASDEDYDPDEASSETKEDEKPTRKRKSNTKTTSPPKQTRRQSKKSIETSVTKERKAKKSS